MIFVVSKSFIDNGEIVKVLETIASQLGLRLAKESNQKYIDLQFFKESEVDTTGFHYFEIALYTQEWFTQTQKSKSFADGYGSLGTIDFDYDDHHLSGLLKLLVNKLPAIILYNEQGNALNKDPFVFSKAHFDVAKDLYSLNQPPLK